MYSFIANKKWNRSERKKRNRERSERNKRESSKWVTLDSYFTGVCEKALVISISIGISFTSARPSMFFSKIFRRSRGSPEMWRLNWILCKPIVKRYRFSANVNEPSRDINEYQFVLLQSTGCHVERTGEGKCCRSAQVGSSVLCLFRIENGLSSNYPKVPFNNYRHQSFALKLCSHKTKFSASPIYPPIYIFYNFGANWSVTHLTR